MFSKAKTAEILTKFAKVDLTEIKDAKLRAQAKGLKAKQGGFTLLELLVVVAILAAIAGTATIALQDTDARASAAAHVTMMDELNKGIRTYRVLNKNTYPNRFDSLLQVADAGASGVAAARDFAGMPAAGALSDAEHGILGFAGDLDTVALGTEAASKLADIGITELTVINEVGTNGGDIAAGDCARAELKNTINSRSNAVVAGNIFLTPAANGCGAVVAIADTTRVAVWTGGYERVMGGDGIAYDATALATDGTDVTAGVAGAPVLMAVGLGPSSNLFNANKLGGMTTVPVYRHVSQEEYGRFVALFEIGKVPATPAAGTAMDPVDQVNLVAIVDGAGDTKEEELGEWDGTRNTI